MSKPTFNLDKFAKHSFFIHLSNGIAGNASGLVLAFLKSSRKQGRNKLTNGEVKDKCLIEFCLPNVGKRMLGVVFLPEIVTVSIPRVCVDKRLDRQSGQTLFSSKYVFDHRRCIELDNGLAFLRAGKV